MAAHFPWEKQPKFTVPCIGTKNERWTQVQIKELACRWEKGALQDNFFFLLLKPLQLTFLFKSCSLWTLSWEFALHNYRSIKMAHTAAHLNAALFWWCWCSMGVNEHICLSCLLFQKLSWTILWCHWNWWRAFLWSSNFQIRERTSLPYHGHKK